MRSVGTCRCVRELGVGDLLDGYRVLGHVARGGMACVYRAIDEATGEAVALKVPHLHYEADVVCFDRFRREEELAGWLAHPGLVRALPTRRPKSRVYLVLEWVEGESVAERLARGGPFPVERALEVARQLADILVYLHARGIVHQDVKPANVLLDRAGRVRLLDLGIAHVETARKLALSGLTASIGTPDYMSPEQLRGSRGDARADLYALGTMLYEMLTARLPWPGADWEERARERRLGAPMPPSAYVPGLAPGVEAIVLRALEPDRRDRYRTAAEVLEHLRDPGAVPARAPAPARAHRRARVDVRLAAAVAAIVAALSLVAGTAWLAHRRGIETRAADAAERAAAAHK
jgi:serine/threonine-protein kinase